MEARQRQAELNNAAAEAREAEQLQEDQIQDEDESEHEMHDPVIATTTPNNSTKSDEQDEKISTNGVLENDVIAAQSPVDVPGQAENDDIEDTDMDRKLPASVPSSSLSPTSAKHVRIIDPEVKQNGESFSDDGRSAFPAFYRVVQDAGAAVYNDGDLVSFVIRIVPFGVVVIGQELSWRECDGEKTMMLRMPDGWVCENDVERIVAVPFDS